MFHPKCLPSPCLSPSCVHVFLAPPVAIVNHVLALEALCARRTMTQSCLSLGILRDSRDGPHALLFQQPLDLL